MHKNIYMKYLKKKKNNFIETGSILEVTRFWEEGGTWSYFLMDTELLFGLIKIFKTYSDSNDCTALWI